MIYKVMDQTGLGYDEGPNKPGEGQTLCSI